MILIHIQQRKIGVVIVASKNNKNQQRYFCKLLVLHFVLQFEVYNTYTAGSLEEARTVQIKNIYILNC